MLIRTISVAVVLVAVLAVMGVGLQPAPEGPVAAQAAASSQPVAPTLAPTPLDLVPAESVLVWKGLPVPDPGAAPAGGSALLTLIRSVDKVWKTLDRQAKLTLDVMETIGVAMHYPFVVSLIDVTATPVRADGTGSRLDQLKLAAIIQTDGDSTPFAGMIQRVLREQTDASVAELRKKQVDGHTYYELHDSRLKKGRPWCVIAWGEIGNYYVITVGAGVWEQVARVGAGELPSIGRDPWMRAVRAGYATEPLVEIIVAGKRIRQRLDPFVAGRATAFFEVWNGEDVEEAHWAFGFKDKAMYCITNSRTNGGTQRRVYANPDLRDERYLNLVPEGSRYAIFEVSMSRVLPRLIGSYYATRPPQDRERAARVWAEIEKKHNVDVDRDALAYLGERVVLHNYPVNPLPFSFTSLIEIREQPEKVRQTLETLCAAWKAALDEAADQSSAPMTTTLERDEDGIWFFKIGIIAGLSWTFTDRYIVTSWSPEALRQYLDEVGPAIGKRPTQ